MTQNIDAEIERLENEIGERYDKLMCLKLEKKYRVEVEIVDDDTIKIDGQEMSKEEFANWLADHDEEGMMERPETIAIN